MFGHHLRAGRYPYVRPYLHVRPSSASRSPSAYSALCCGQIAYPRAHIDTPGTKLSKHAPASSPTGTKLSLFSRSVGPTGTKLSQHAQKRPFQHVLPEQGELSTAPSTTTPSRENFVPRPAPNPVQNSPCSAGPSAQPVQNSPNTPTPAAQPVQNSPNTHRPTSLPRISSPSTPKNGVFRLFCACWASFVAHKQPTGHAGRVFSRSMVRTDSPGGSFHWDRLLEPMSVAHGCDNGETTAGGASLRCLLRRVGAWPGSTRTIQTHPIGGCHVADRAWLRRPWVPEGPGRASRSITPSRQARVWRSRGQAAAHRCHPRAHQAARPHRHAPPDTRHQTRARNTSGATTTDTTKRAGTSRFRPALDTQRLSAPRARWRHATGGATRQVLTGARQQSAVSSARPPCRPCRSSRR